MAIKKSKNNESITDFDNMMNEVEEELEVQQAEQGNNCRHQCQAILGIFNPPNPA